ncbi:MAG: hypothetical protein IJM52_03120 [Spirochaetales bacterium]|nr:hypothetical protein [Spirochaetales bacterium]
MEKAIAIALAVLLGLCLVGSGEFEGLLSGLADSFLASEGEPYDYSTGGGGSVDSLAGNMDRKDHGD